MKKNLAGILCFMLFLSCTKQNVFTRNEAILPLAQNDSNLQVKSFSALQSKGIVKVTFTTAFEKNLTQVVLLHGSSAFLFCKLKDIDTNGNSAVERTYSLIDNVPQGDTTYYIIKYTTLNGDWGCSNLYKSNH